LQGTDNLSNDVADADGSNGKARVLCLHGFLQSAEVSIDQTGPLLVHNRILFSSPLSHSADYANEGGVYEEVNEEQVYL
jgi:hypothetical protein